MSNRCDVTMTDVEMKHECIIGALFLGELELVTLEDVKKYVAETKDINRQIDEHPIYRRYP